MKHRLFKYVSKLEYAHDLIQGKVFHQTLGYFRDYEDSTTKQVIGDEYESTRIFRPIEGLSVNNLSLNSSITLQAGFESSVKKPDEIFVFCASLALTEEQKEEFKAVACVEILNPRDFIQRWQKALPSDATSFAKKVDYYAKTSVPENVWPQPELIASTKIKNFSYQQEYRLGFSTTDALDFGNCTQQLIDRQIRPLPRPDEHHICSIDIGNIQNICKLHIF